MKKLKVTLFMVIALCMLVGCDGTISTPDTSLEGFQQIRRGLSLNNVQILLGETATELSEDRWGIATNQTERVLEFEDREHPEITYRIELDNRNQVISYAIRVSVGTLPILEEATADLNLNEIQEEFFPNFVLNENRGSERIFRRDIAHHISRADWNRRFGSGIENRLIDHRILYFQNGRTYSFFFDSSDRLSEISISRGTPEEQTLTGNLNETLELVNWDIVIEDIRISDVIDWISENFYFTAEPGMEFVVVSLTVTSRDGNAIRRFEPGLAVIRAGRDSAQYHYVPIGMVRWDLVGNFGPGEERNGFIAFQVSQESLNNENIPLILEFTEEHLTIEFDIRQ